MQEAGGPAIESSTWVLFLAPAGTPKEIVDRIAAATSKAIALPDLKARLDGLSVIPGGGTPADARKFLEGEIERWAKVIETAGVKVEQ